MVNGKVLIVLQMNSRCEITDISMKPVFSDACLFECMAQGGRDGHRPRKRISASFLLPLVLPPPPAPLTGPVLGADKIAASPPPELVGDDANDVGSDGGRGREGATRGVQEDRPSVAGYAALASFFAWNMRYQIAEIRPANKG